MRELESRAALIPNGKSIFRAPLEIYHDQDESNFDFEQGDSAHKRAVSPSCTGQRSSGSKVIRSEILAASIIENRQSRNMGGFQKCPLCPFLSSVDLAQYTTSTHHTTRTKIEGLI
jgi:hypothetical protein